MPNLLARNETDSHLPPLLSFVILHPIKDG
jgi:hypothetical protein